MPRCLPVLLCLPLLMGAIVGGEPDTTHREVAALLWEEDFLCSAVLVGPRTLVTAAHCLAGWEALVTEIDAVFAPDPASAAPELRVPLVAALLHDPVDGSFQADLARLTLAADAPSVPGPWNVEPLLDDHLGVELDLVGFGDTAAGDEGANLRRHATVALGDWNEAMVFWSDDAAGACHGDSGGAVFADLGRGALLVAVMTGGDPNCLGEGEGARTDTFDAFLSGSEGGDDDTAAPPVAFGDDDDSPVAGCRLGAEPERGSSGANLALVAGTLGWSLLPRTRRRSP